MKKKLLLILVVVTVFGLVFADVGWHWLIMGLPAPEALVDRFQPPSVRITDRFGRIMYEALPEQGGRHNVIGFGQIPLTMRQATIATEDRRYYTHPGVDIVGIVRAIWINLKGGQTRSGGSTITQQVARNLLLNPGERYERSLMRKLRESYIAWELDKTYTKDEILGIYLNQTYYGAMAYGIEAAAQTYFGKSVSELDLAECALIAGLPQAPALYNPFTDPDTAKERAQTVLRLMEEAGYINAEQRTLAGREELIFSSTPYPVEAPHFVLMVRKQLDQLFTQEEIYEAGGMVVRTTLDLDWQHQAEAVIQRQLEALKHTPDGLGHHVGNAALVALDPASGEIFTLVGSKDFFDTTINGSINMAIAPRQPGSALKPIVYAAALDPISGKTDNELTLNKGRTNFVNLPSLPWTAATLLWDIDTSFLTHEDHVYKPENYDQKEHGPVLVRQALASSLNIPAVITLNQIGLDKTFDLARILGITTLGDPRTYDLSLALGGGAVRLIELTSAYGAFSNGGFRVNPSAILSVEDFQGKMLWEPQPLIQERVVDERVAWLISDILSDNAARTLGFGSNSLLRIDRPAAVKTGTTSNFHDNWTIGYTPNLVVGVWSGNANYEPMREVNGLTGAAPIWHDFIRIVLQNKPTVSFKQPQGLKQVEICALSGFLPGDVCPYKRMEWFITGTEPTSIDPLYKRIEVDVRDGRLADEKTPAMDRKLLTALDVPPEAVAWAYSQGIITYKEIVSQENREKLSHSSQGNNKIQLVSPASHSQIIYNPGINDETQKLMVEAIAGSEVKQIELWIDDQIIARLDKPPYQFWWPLAKGTHRAWATGRTSGGQPVTSPVITFDVQ